MFVKNAQFFAVQNAFEQEKRFDLSKETSLFPFEAARNLAFGVASGLATYGFVRFFIDATANYTPYILFGVSGSLITNGIRLAHIVALHALGDYSKYNQPTEENQQRAVDRLRVRCWKVIKQAEDLHMRVDVCFSKVFKIRPAHEVDKVFSLLFLESRSLEEMQVQPMSTIKPTFLEIIRKVFWMQVKESFLAEAPAQGSLIFVKSLNYKVWTGFNQALSWLYGVQFIVGLWNKMGEVDARIAKEIEQEELLDGIDFLQKGWPPYNSTDEEVKSQGRWPPYNSTDEEEEWQPKCFDENRNPIPLPEEDRILYN